MPGVFLLVQKVMQCGGLPVLFDTDGGHPHITFVYHKNKDMRERWAKVDVRDLFFRPFRISDVAINSFTKDDGIERHDVLLTLEPAFSAMIQCVRGTCFFPDGAITHDPHITVGTFPTLAQATSRAALVKERGVLTCEFQVYGVFH